MDALSQHPHGHEETKLEFATVVQLLAPCDGAQRACAIVQMSILQPSIHPLLKLPVIHRNGAMKALNVQVSLAKR